MLNRKADGNLNIPNPVFLYYNYVVKNSFHYIVWKY